MTDLLIEILQRLRTVELKTEVIRLRHKFIDGSVNRITSRPIERLQTYILQTGCRNGIMFLTERFNEGDFAAIC